MQLDEPLEISHAGFVTLVFLPYEAWISSDAIIRTLYRKAWSKHRMLEWKTASDSSCVGDSSLLYILRTISAVALFAFGALLALGCFIP